MDQVNEVGLSPDAIATLITRSARYKRQGWFALIGLVGFLLSYFSAAIWFAVSGVRLLLEAYPQSLGGLPQWIVGLSAVFLSAFMPNHSLEDPFVIDKILSHLEGRGSLRFSDSLLKEHARRVSPRPKTGFTPSDSSATVPTHSLASVIPCQLPYQGQPTAIVHSG